MVPGRRDRRGRRLRLADTQDRDDITDLVYRLGACLDEHLFEDLRTLLTDDVTARTPGGEAHGIDAVVAQATHNHAGYRRLQHVITNLLIDLDGDRAAVRANLVAVLVRPADHGQAMLGSVYRFRLRRTPRGWRFTHVRVDPVWQTG